ncbi:hypothetical protein AB0H63_10670 [Micromonospora echinospora]|uniref:hypothetical protein n=1 Tax=Micromonospora echinospora TaxID=1877 RepID=UPI0033F374AC
MSLPPDVADYLQDQENASAAVTDAVRAQMDRGAATAAMLRAVGIAIPEDRVRGRLPRLTDEQRAEVRRRRDMLRDGTWSADDNAA